MAETSAVGWICWREERRKEGCTQKRCYWTKFGNVIFFILWLSFFMLIQTRRQLICFFFQPWVFTQFCLPHISGIDGSSRLRTNLRAHLITSVSGTFNGTLGFYFISTFISSSKTVPWLHTVVTLITTSWLAPCRFEGLSLLRMCRIV